MDRMWTAVAIALIAATACGAADDAVMGSQEGSEGAVTKPAGEESAAKVESVAIQKPPVLPAKETWYQLFAGGQRVGHLMQRVTEAANRLKVEETFDATRQGKAVTYETKVLYDLQGSPRPVWAEAVTTLNGVKLMEGRLVFVRKAGPDGKEKAVIVAAITGYVDRKLEKLEEPEFMQKEVPWPGGVLLFQSVAAALAPRLLPKAGQVEDVTVAEFPDDINFPELVNFKSGRVLVRTPPGETGESRIALREPGRGDDRDFLTMTVDGKGEIAIVRLGKFELRRASREEATKPVEAEKPERDPAEPEGKKQPDGA